MSTASSHRTTFLAILVVEFLNLLGAGMAAITVTLMVYERTEDASALAMLLAVRTFTSIFFAPFAGAIVDRFKQRHVLLASNAGLAATVGALFLMACSGTVNLYLIAAVLFVQALADSVAQSLLISVVRALVGNAELVRSNSLVHLVQSVPQIGAPAVGAWLFTVGGPDTVFACSLLALSLALSLVAMLGRGLPVVERSPWKSPFQHVSKGFRLIWRHPGLRRLQLSYTSLNFFNGLSAAGLVVYVTRNAGSMGWGTYSALGGAGLMAGALGMWTYKRAYRTERLLPLVQAGAAVGGRILLAVPGAYWLWILGNFSRNAGMQITGGPMTALWQRESPAAALGVISGCRRLISQGLYPFAVFAGGIAYNWWTTHVGKEGLFFLALGLAELAAVLTWLYGPVNALLTAQNSPVAAQEPPTHPPTLADR